MLQLFFSIKNKKINFHFLLLIIGWLLLIITIILWTSKEHYESTRQHLQNIILIILCVGLIVLIAIIKTCYFFNKYIFQIEQSDILLKENQIKHEKESLVQIKKQNRELNFLYNLTKIAEKNFFNFDELIKEVINQIPATYTYPDLTCVRIIIKDKSFYTCKFQETIWRHKSNILVFDIIIGFIEVYFLDEIDQLLHYEKNIIEAVAIKLGNLIERFEEKKILKIKEQQLLHAQKMEAMGKMAGGIAHNLNNILAIILGYAELLLIKDPKSNSLNQIFNNVMSGSNIIKGLLTFTRTSNSKFSLVNLNDIIQRLKESIFHLIPPMIEIQLALDNKLYDINADSSQIEQLIINICINAGDAIQSCGIISIKTENSIIDDKFIESHTVNNRILEKGNYVLLTITDNGPGMNKDTLQKIFDPFFTTKEIGKGTGLGLSTVYGIVESHNGYIICQSTLGKGTIFQIYLPAINHVKTEDIISDSDNNQKLLIDESHETILIVDDQEDIRSIIQQNLEIHGYKTLQANSGESALEIYKSYQYNIDLILLDLGMPGMGGKICLEKLIQLNPNVKVIIATGYGYSKNDQGLENILKTGAIDFIIKPFSQTDLLILIKKHFKQIKNI